MLAWLLHVELLKAFDKTSGLANALLARWQAYQSSATSPTTLFPSLLLLHPASLPMPSDACHVNDHAAAQTVQPPRRPSPFGSPGCTGGSHFTTHTVLAAACCADMLHSFRCLVRPRTH
jgi:hypothetical protein